jgi:DNA polymerase-3 subunit gamma/tau
MRRDAARNETVGNLATVAAPQVSAPPEDAMVPRAFNSFMDIVSLATEKRDVKLKSELERFVRPVRVAHGKIEVALEPGAPPQLLNELMRKLEAWTSRRWIVGLSREEGAEPLAKVKKAAQVDALKTAREHPDIQAILKKFPGSEITDVRVPQPDVSTPQTEDSDEEPQ